MNYKITRLDLVQDWLGIVKQKLIADNYDISKLNDDSIFIEFFTINLRKVSIKKRNIKKAASFSCPSNLQNGLDLLEKKIIDGESLHSHQSRKLKDLEIKDGLLFDWNIHHFHLGTEMENDNFIKRTGPLLYAYVDEDNVYFLDVLNHGNWTKSELVKIIHDNWPEAIEHMKINRNDEEITLSHNPTDVERKHLRDFNSNTFVEIDKQNIYLGLGWGFSGAGKSISATEQYLDSKRSLIEIENNLKNNTEEYLLKIFDSLDFIKNKNLNFELIFENNIHKIIEQNNKFEILLNR